MRRRRLTELLSSQAMALATVSCSLLVIVMIGALFLRARPILAAHSLSELLLSHSWRPLKGQFGFWPFIMGTLWVTIPAMLIAVPPSLLVAIYLAEYAHGRIRATIKPLVDLLAGIPSVVYGLWGILFVVPAIQKYVVPFAGERLSFVGVFSGGNPSGYSVLAGGLVLAVMVFPITISVSDEVLRAVPRELREASLAVGATYWQTVKHVVLRKAMPGVIASIILGFSRAFGETMAVLMVVGNVPRAPSSLLDAAYPLPALIANSYGEMMSVPLYDSALLLAALILLLIVLVFTVAARVVLVRAIRRAA
jgi:phosphate transport system permease protein